MLTTLLCRMKSHECDQKGIFDIGFVDPVRINEKLLLEFPEETERQLAKVHTEATLQKEDIVSLQLRVRLLLSCTH